MKKFFLAAAIAAVCVTFTGCTEEFGATNDNAGGIVQGNYDFAEDSTSDTTAQALHSDIGGILSAVQTHSNGFGVSFLTRNETGKRLYYNDDFRVDSQALTERNNPAGVQFINHGDTKDTYVSWGGERPTGMYAFERDFFLDAELTELYTTLSFDFAVIAWYHFTDDAPPIPANLQTHRDEQARNSLEFQIAGGASRIIVLASEVAVSRTEIAFSTANLSTQPFIHGLDYRLLVYENGWKPTPKIVDDWAVVSIGFRMDGGQIIEDTINFGGLHGTLENGRYMLMRNHHIGNTRPGAPRVLETLMVEFVIDDNTPTRLDGAEPSAAKVSLYADEITPTGLRLNITNHTSQELSFNAPIVVQKYVYGNWENIYELNAPGRNILAVPANEAISINENWPERFGKLPPGRYKLTAHFGTRVAAAIVTHEFYIPQDVESSDDVQLNPMFQQNIVATDVTVTPTGMSIRWENISDRIFYTPWTGYWVESYSPEEGRDANRLREAFDSTFSGPDADLRSVTIDIIGGGSWTFDTTAVHPGQHVYQTINWERELPEGQYVISLGHFNPYEPGFMYWIRPWERFLLMFSIE